ncbi:hypothetical protein [Knoellia koreensis]|uniref:Alpha/beta hydrolase n=1 Tax=Knoellia koreensis TaxID=2730921 RepID=A0A849HBJ0_9MICO|nr:hypothetical protein [Knoellia sp. DB2414S]NNM44702.1 hypothetical protein [Knoellia sp. DB2414S]
MTSVRTFAWGGNRNADPVGTVILLPGRGYGVQLPVLHYPATVLASLGWHVQAVAWQADDLDVDDAPAFAAGAAELCLEAAPSDRVLVVGKSLGTFAAPWARARGIPGIWLTPILTQPTVRDALAPGGPPGLLVGGTADEGAWDSSAARATGLTVLELAGLDHSLEDSTDWRRGVEAMLTVGAAVEDFARGL